jgi:hypothetical protein
MKMWSCLLAKVYHNRTLDQFNVRSIVIDPTILSQSIGLMHKDRSHAQR